MQNNNTINILAIETSCDDTSASLLKLENNNLTNHKFEIGNWKLEILQNVVSSQLKLHTKYGGVYPELASREHVKNIIPVIKEALTNFNLNYIDYFAVTKGPGLIGSLLVGVETAKTLSYIFNKPLIPIHHIEGHIYSNFVNLDTKFKILNPKQIKNSNNSSVSLKNLGLKNLKIISDSEPIYSDIPSFPLIALIASGGHTNLIYMKNHLSYQVIGYTLDDAVGEAFDKVAVMLDLGYPGGPIISKLAQKYDDLNQKYKNLDIHFPRPMISSPDLNFSFSGLKTSVLYKLKKLPKKLNNSYKIKIAKEFQDAIIETLISKTIRAAKKYKVKSIILGGGVASNTQLRKELKKKIDKCKMKIGFFVPEKSLCTDNAAMIGIAAAHRIILGKKIPKWYDIDADSNLELE